MKKVWISGLLLLAVVVLTVLTQTSGADRGQNKSPVPYDRGQTAAEDADPLPESAMAVKDGILYSKDLVVGNAPEGYFRDALFIGDSRTVGLKDYGGMEGATWFCAVSLGVMNYEKKDVKVDGYGSISLMDLLAKKSFSKIYICLGINEIGYDLGTLQKRYVAFAQTLQEKVPAAKIIFMSNLHVASARSDTDKWVNNGRINELNGYFKAMQDGLKVFYMDINPLFDDANGALDKKYTTDNTHLLGKYYSIWADHINSHAIYENQ